MYSGREYFSTRGRENLIFSIIDLFAFSYFSLKIQGIMTLDNESLIIVNIYRHSNQTFPFAVFDQLFSTLLNTYSKVIFIGDFNAHYPWWGCEYEDSARKPCLVLSKFII